MGLTIILLINLILLALIIYLLYSINNKYNKINNVIEEFREHISAQKDRINRIDNNAVLTYNATIDLFNLYKEKHQNTIRKPNSDEKVKFIFKSNLD